MAEDKKLEASIAVLAKSNFDKIISVIEKKIRNGAIGDVQKFVEELANLKGIELDENGNIIVLDKDGNPVKDADGNVDQVYSRKEVFEKIQNVDQNTRMKNSVRYTKDATGKSKGDARNELSEKIGKLLSVITREDEICEALAQKGLDLDELKDVVDERKRKSNKVIAKQEKAVKESEQIKEVFEELSEISELSDVAETAKKYEQVKENLVILKAAQESLDKCSNKLIAEKEGFQADINKCGKELAELAEELSKNGKYSVKDVNLMELTKIKDPVKMDAVIKSLNDNEANSRKDAEKGISDKIRDKLNTENGLGKENEEVRKAIESKYADLLKDESIDINSFYDAIEKLNLEIKTAKKDIKNQKEYQRLQDKIIEDFEKAYEEHEKTSARLEGDDKHYTDAAKDEVVKGILDEKYAGKTLAEAKEEDKRLELEKVEQQVNAITSEAEIKAHIEDMLKQTNKTWGEGNRTIKGFFNSIKRRFIMRNPKKYWEKNMKDNYLAAARYDVESESENKFKAKIDALVEDKRSEEVAKDKENLDIISVGQAFHDKVTKSAAARNLIIAAISDAADSKNKVDVKTNMVYDLANSAAIDSMGMYIESVNGHKVDPSKLAEHIQKSLEGSKSSDRFKQHGDKADEEEER